MSDHLLGVSLLIAHVLYGQAEVSAHTPKREEAQEDNYEDEIFVGLSRSPWLTTTLMWQYTKLEILDKHSLWGFETEIKPIDTLSFKVFAGSRKGGLVCSSGVCRVVDPFEGVEFRAEIRF